MKQIVIAIAASTILATAAGSAIAKTHYKHGNNNQHSNRSYSDSYQFHPYVGVEYKYQHMRGKNDWNKVMPKDFHGGTVFIGEKFHKHWGLEVGYSHSARDSKDRNFTATDTFFTTPIAAAFTNRAKVRVTSYQLDVNGYCPLSNHINLLGSIGVAGAKAKVKIDAVAGNAQSGNLASIGGKRKAIPRIGFGTEWKHDRYGIRGMIRWEGTNRLRLNERNLKVSFPSASGKYYKDSVSLNVGAYIQFL